MTPHDDDFDDDLLRHYYEKELELLRRNMRTFAQRNPEAAARLSINSDGRSDDPGVERLAQSTALLHARQSAKIDDDYPELSEAVVRRTYPQYLRPFPSCSIVQFDIGSLFNSSTQSVQIDRGTRLQTEVGKFSFRTAYDVVLAPVRITRARYASTPNAPPNVTLPPDASGVVSVTFRSAKAGRRLDVAPPKTLRIHIAGQPPIVAALIDTMRLRTARAYVEDRDGKWTRLADRPLEMVGFGPQDWLFTDAKEPGQAFGLLGEYFAFEQRFHFVDVDFASLCAAAPGDELTLHLVVAGVPPNSSTAQQLLQLSADHLKLFCTPIVNLFTKVGVSLKCDPESREWPLAVGNRNEAHVDVWSVDQVRTEQGTALSSSDSLMTSHANGRPRWRFIRRTRPVASDSAIDDVSSLHLTEVKGPKGVGGGIDSLLADVTCTNGDLPRSIPIGASNGDLRPEGKAQAAKKIALLYAPTALMSLPRTNGALWRLIGEQTPHAIKLDQAGLPTLKEMFRQFATLSPQQARHVDGIRGLRHRSVMTLMARPPQPAMVRGIEITLEIDEQRFVANSMAVFARVMERYFAPYAPTNSFIQLVVLSSSGGIIWRGEPVKGAQHLL